MTRDEWDGLSLLIEEWWPGEFGDVTAGAYWHALEGFGVDEVHAALKACLAGGSRWRPAASEILAEIRNDPSAPTFEECYRLIYGNRGILRARGPRGPFLDMAEMRRAQHEAMRARAAECHALVASFVDRYGLDGLRALEVDHPDYGALRRKELREAWDAHCDAMEDRDVAALVAGRRGELGRFDPLRALPGPRQLERNASS